MGIKSKYSGTDKEATQNRYEAFAGAAEGFARNFVKGKGANDIREWENEYNGYEFCFNVNGGNTINLNSDGEYVLIDPRFLSGEKSANECEFYSLVNHEYFQMGVESEIQKISFDDVLAKFDPKIRDSNDKAETELRKNTVLWNTLGFDSLKDKVLDSVKAEGVERPHRGFWGTIRDWFGKGSEGRRKYEREKEVYYAKKCSELEKKYDIKGLEYNKLLADETIAKDYIEKNIDLKEEARYNESVEKALKNSNDVYTAINDGTLASYETEGITVIQKFLKDRDYKNPKNELDENVKKANEKFNELLEKHKTALTAPKPRSKAQEKIADIFKTYFSIIGSNDRSDMDNPRSEDQVKEDYCDVIGKLEKSLAKNESESKEAEKKKENDISASKENQKTAEASVRNNEQVSNQREPETNVNAADPKQLLEDANKTLEYFKKSTGTDAGIIKSGADIISKIINDPKYDKPQNELDAKVKKANESFKEFMEKYGKDIREGHPETQVSDLFRNVIGNICHTVDHFDDIRIRADKDYEELLTEYCDRIGKLQKTAPKLDEALNNPVKAASESNADVKEGIENVNAGSLKNEQINEQPEEEAPADVPEQKEPEKPKIPTANELMIKATNDVLDACVSEESLVGARKGAEAIKSYLADDPQLATVEGQQMAKYIGAFKKQIHGNEAPENVKKFCDKICRLVGANVLMNDGEPDAASKAVKAVTETYFQNDKSAQRFIETEMAKQKAGFSIGGPQ